MPKPMWTQFATATVGQHQQCRSEFGSYVSGGAQCVGDALKRADQVRSLAIVVSLHGLGWELELKCNR